MNEVVFIILGFVFCAAVVIFSGIRLSKWGDVIAEKSKIGKAWIGLVLLASVTSVPELVSGISAVTIFDFPNLAVGDVFGSCVFNLLIISVLDMFSSSPLTSRIDQAQIIAGVFGIIMMSFFLVSLLFPDFFPTLAWFSSCSLAFLGLYFFSVKVMYNFDQKRRKTENDSTPESDSITLSQAIAKFSIHAFIVMLAAVSLPYFGGEIAKISGLSTSFVGTVFIAASTSLPELVVSLSAIRMGNPDMAAGNLFGSNIFNLVILAIDDFFYTKGNLFQLAERVHGFSAASTIAMTGVAIIGLVYRPGKKGFYLAWDALAILMIYVVNLIFLASHS